MMILKENITSVIPQRPPFVMIDQLVSCDDTYSSATFKIAAENVLVENGHFSEAGIIENIAQTAAAGFGYLSWQSNDPVRIGYIAAIKNLEIFALPEVGSVIETNVSITNRVFDITIVTGIVKYCGITIAKCEMKIYIQR